MFDELSEKLDSVLGRFRQRGVLTEPMVRDGLRESGGSCSRPT
jgi:hypothetical protein